MRLEMMGNQGYRLHVQGLRFCGITYHHPISQLTNGLHLNPGQLYYCTTLCVFFQAHLPRQIPSWGTMVGKTFMIPIRLGTQDKEESSLPIRDGLCDHVQAVGSDGCILFVSISTLVIGQTDGIYLSEYPSSGHTEGANSNNTRVVQYRSKMDVTILQGTDWIGCLPSSPANNRRPPSASGVHIP